VAITVNNHSVKHYLKYDTLNSSPRLAHLLPRELAYRYHALPVAQDGNQITVAMANPDDVEAREAIIHTLGSKTCVVSADPYEIDKLITELWSNGCQTKMNILAWAPTDTIATEIAPLANGVASLLNTDLNKFQTTDQGLNAYKLLADEAEREKADLIIFKGPGQSLLKRLILEPQENKLVDLVSASLLVARGPRWPLKRILLVIRNEATDQDAVDWVIRLAHPSDAEVTVLPLITPGPQMYRYDNRMQYSLSSLLSTDCSFGRKLRWIAHRLVDWDIEGTLRLREEPPFWQIRCEAIEGDYDMVIIANEPPNRVWRWLLGELVNPLLSWADRPILIAKPLLH
jgi:nucleotide-binding universal stress UspA family protein